VNDAVVFISHAEEDHEIAMRLCTALEAATIRCWIAPRDIPAGDSYLDGINHGLALAGIVIVILSEHANASDWVLREVETSTSRKIRVIPARLRQTTPSAAMGLLLSTLQWVDLGDGSSPQALSKLVAVVKGKFEGKSSQDDLKANDAVLNLLAITSIVFGLLVGAWGVYALLSAKGRQCLFFGFYEPCSVGGGFLVVASFCILVCGASLWKRSRLAVVLAWVCVLMLVPGAIDGILHRYSGLVLPAAGLGIFVPVAIACEATRRRKQLW
jgi:hypothetical protein